jgi:hypothetical protein
MMTHSGKSRPGPPKGRSAEPRLSNSAVAVDQQEWVFMVTPAVVDKALLSESASSVDDTQLTDALLKKVEGLGQRSTHRVSKGFPFGAPSRLWSYRQPNE